MDCGADVGKMKALARFYINHLIRLFRGDKGSTPAPSEHSSRSSFETRRRSFSDAVDAAPTSHQAAKIAALRRDNYRCVVTGWADISSLKHMGPDDLERYNITADTIRCHTNYCHIFPPSTNWGFDSNDPADKKKKYAGSVWAILESFNIDVLSKLNGEKIHHLGNGFTMDMELHTMFDALELWFEHDAVPVCRVAHLSGAAGYLDREERESESRGVLALDGSSAALLASRLAHVALVV
ncbi:hypothetical protein BJ912DRAFT_951804 [Pholiota molesta]|nr:hypothetical protein BJ912DRAFT_951804 [Pholiota molesta]